MTMLVIATSPVLVTVPVKPIRPPGNPLVVGHVLVSTNRGVVSTGQVMVAFVVIRLLHRSRAVAVNVSVTEHTSKGTGSVPLKLAPWPGSNRPITVTGVLLVG